MREERLSGLDASFLHLERGGAHMHVASVLIFEGPPPAYEDFCDHVASRLHLVPRFRRKLRGVPFGQGRPVWVDDPHWNLQYHVRLTALPPPGDEGQLRQLASRVFSQQLDRTKPLWELWLVQGLEGDRFAILGKSHHALVDGISGIDIVTVLFDLDREPASTPPPAQPWLPRPEPSRTELLGRALAERATQPAEIARGVRALARGPRRMAKLALEVAGGAGALAWAGLRSAPPSPFNVEIGSHRRYTWVRGDLARFKAIKNSFDGTVNDVVLAVVTGALGRFLRAHGHSTMGLELKAMVPVSVRSDLDRGSFGNQVTAMIATLPVWCEDPLERLALVQREMGDLKTSSQAIGAQALTQLADFAPSTILNQAARLQSRQRLFNLVVTNVPGPQLPLYVLGRRMEAVFPMLPLAARQALGIAVMSYDGQLNFGLLGDYDAMADLDGFAAAIEASIAELVEVVQMDKDGSQILYSGHKTQVPAMRDDV